MPLISPAPGTAIGAQPVARWPLALATALLVGGCALSVWAWQRSAAFLGAQADAELDRFSELTFSNIGQHAQHQIDVLAGFQALFRASDGVSREEFHRHFRDQRVQVRFPGLRAVQFAQWVDHADRAGIDASAQTDPGRAAGGFAASDLHPPGGRNADRVVAYNEPMQGNETALGADSLAQAQHREVAERARDQNLPQASAPVDLPQLGPSVVLHLPLYRRGAATDTVAQRRAACVGEVSGVWQLSDVLRHALPSMAGAPFQVQVSDQGLAEPAALADTDPTATANPPAAAIPTQPAPRLAIANTGEPGPAWASAAARPQPGDRRVQSLAMAGRLWTVEVARAHPDPTRAALPLLLLGGGLSITLLLALAAGRLTLMQRRAQQLALAMSAQARANADRLHAVVNSAVDGLITADRHGTLLSVNPAAQRIFGHTAQRMVGHSLNLLMPLGAAAQIGQWLEPVAASPGRSRRLQARRCDGTLFPIDLAVSNIVVDGQRQYVALLRDMSEAQAAQDRIDAAAHALQAANGLREAVFEHAPVALIVCNARGVIQAMNPAAERLLGCRAADEVGHHTLASFHDEADGDALAAASAASTERTLNLIRRDKHRVPVSLTVSALHDRDGSVSGFLGIAYDITERQRLADQMSQLAYHDALTGLPNRIRLEDHLNQAIAKAGRSQDALALLFIDLDRFKPINDSHGHAVGDLVLCEVARRLQGALRVSDMVARLGGDEFVVLLPTLVEPDDCLVVADKLLTALAEPMQIGTLTLQVGASMGVARHPECGNNAAELLRSADAAMYRVKLAGRETLQQAAQADRTQRF